MAQPERRALPPRPTLLVGDKAACVQAWATLRPQALAMLAEAQLSRGADCWSPSSKQAEAWDALVRKFRSLRESLVSEHVVDGFTAEVYELGADVCGHARNNPELLKCIQRLVHELYPLLLNDDATRDCSSVEPSTSSPGHLDASAEEWSTPGVGALSAAPRLVGRRQGEMVAAYLLYFACVPAGRLGRRTIETVDAVRTVAAAHLGSHHVRFALAALRALWSRDYLAFTRLHAAADSPLLKLLLAQRLPEVQAAGLHTIASAYRSLPVSALERVLGLQPEAVHPKAAESAAAAAKEKAWGEVPAAPPTDAFCDLPLHVSQLLQAAATQGCKGAAFALQKLASTDAEAAAPAGQQQGPPVAISELWFKT